MKLAQSDQNEIKDIEDTQKLFDLIQGLDYYNNSIKLEKMRVADLDNKVGRSKNTYVNHGTLLIRGYDN